METQPLPSRPSFWDSATAQACSLVSSFVLVWWAGSLVCDALRAVGVLP